MASGGRLVTAQRLDLPATVPARQQLGPTSPSGSGRRVGSANAARTHRRGPRGTAALTSVMISPGMYAASLASRPDRRPGGHGPACQPAPLRTATHYAAQVVAGAAGWRSRDSTSVLPRLRRASRPGHVPLIAAGGLRRANSARPCALALPASCYPLT